MFPCCLIVLSSGCTLFHLLAILDVQAHQRTQCDIHCRQDGVFAALPGPNHTLCVHLKCSSGSQGATEHKADGSPMSLSSATKKYGKQNKTKQSTGLWHYEENHLDFKQPGTPHGT